MQQILTASGKTIYSFRLGSFFPPQVYSCGVLGIPVGIYLFFHGMFLQPLLVLFFSILLVTASKGVAINFKKKWVKKYVRMGGLPFGNEIPYQELEEFVLVKRRVSQSMYSRASSTTLRYDLYQAFALTDRQKFLLVEGKRKEKVLARLQALCRASGVPINDLT